VYCPHTGPCVMGGPGVRGDVVFRLGEGVLVWSAGWSGGGYVPDWRRRGAVIGVSWPPGGCLLFCMCGLIVSGDFIFCVWSRFVVFVWVC
jgi:hypothetical protein